jgi:hypothetical protein
MSLKIYGDAQEIDSETIADTDEFVGRRPPEGETPSKLIRTSWATYKLALRNFLDTRYLRLNGGTMTGTINSTVAQGVPMLRYVSALNNGQFAPYIAGTNDQSGEQDLTLGGMNRLVLRPNRITTPNGTLWENGGDFLVYSNSGFALQGRAISMQTDGANTKIFEGGAGVDYDTYVRPYDSTKRVILEGKVKIPGSIVENGRTEYIRFGNTDQSGRIYSPDPTNGPFTLSSANGVLVENGLILLGPTAVQNIHAYNGLSINTAGNIPVSFGNGRIAFRRPTNYENAEVGYLNSSWIESNHATRRGQMSFNLNDWDGEKQVIRFDSNRTDFITSLGFNGYLISANNTINFLADNGNGNGIGGMSRVNAWQDGVSSIFHFPREFNVVNAMNGGGLRNREAFLTKSFQISDRSEYGYLTIPSDSALATLDSTTRGFLLPRMTTTQRDAIASPAEGLEIYNLDSHEKNYFNGTQWRALSSVAA